MEHCHRRRHRLVGWRLLRDEFADGASLAGHEKHLFFRCLFTRHSSSCAGNVRSLILYRLTGFMLLLGAAGFGMMDISYHAVFIGLILVGLGWNLVYVGGGALLTQK